MPDFDVIVVGGGHAGCEAALAAAGLGCKTCLLTINVDSIAAMSCNPAIGGPAAKSHLVREIDALGGRMGMAIDRSYLNIRLLNESRGPAVQALRAQADKKLYQRIMLSYLFGSGNIFIRQGMVTELLFNGGKIRGVLLQTGVKIDAEAVILATGTFLGGQIVIGDKTWPGGRQGEPCSAELAAHLKDLGLEVRRFQTATPPRLDGRTVDFGKLNSQAPDPRPWQFSFRAPREELTQKPCWWTATTPETVRLIRDKLAYSPIKSGMIRTHGPSFCPSIDRKVLRFPEKTDHLVFLEPEGRHTEELYALGLTTAMPEEIQGEIVRTVRGLEHAELLRPGYAVEYDYLPGWQMHPWMENKKYPGLFTAGQINGTSGYEEAAAQGLWAGINAARKLKGVPPAILSPTEAYLGVMIDDLTLRDHEEPYRMMTSFADFRLHLRHDTADERLLPLGKAIGLISPEEFDAFELKAREIKSEFTRLAKRNAGGEETRILADQGIAINRPVSFRALLMRPEISQEAVAALDPKFAALSFEIRRKIETELKFEGYRQREDSLRRREEELEKVAIPDLARWDGLNSLSPAGRQLLEKFSPRTLAKALRIQGLSEQDRQVLPVLLKQEI
ncbi:MAG: tRNA uridine-5-carboxymethylaminomethyl(34) synthesis enzyme MnmG [Bacillota bacterium]